MIWIENKEYIFLFLIFFIGFFRPEITRKYVKVHLVKKKKKKKFHGYMKYQISKIEYSQYIIDRIDFFQDL
jgi:hypothetical protein